MDTYKITEFLNYTIIKDSGKTLTIGVGSNNGAKLGYIKWMPTWRRYSFYPEPGTLFDAACLEDVTNELKQLMEDRKTQK